MNFGSSGHDSHTGNLRPHNEDSYRLDEELGLAILADGMGGYAGGEIASRIVVDSVYQEVSNGLPLAESLVKAHKAVLTAANNGQGRKGMGSTVLAVKLDNELIEIVWVGDSRAYLWNERKSVV